MVIAKSAIREFLHKPLCDSAKVKLFTAEALDRKIAKLLPRPRFYTAPRKHQKACFLLGVKYPAYLMLLDMGLGKSKLSLDLLNYWRRCGRVKRTLVLVPNTTNVEGWLDEVKLHAPNIDAVGDRLDAGGQLVICTYAKLLTLVCDRVDKKSKDGKNTGKRKMVPSKKLFKKFCHGFDSVIFDEITAAKNHRSLTFRVCNWLATICDVRYGLTGTPFSSDPEDLWAVFYLIDRGATLGQTLGMVRAAFFTATKSFWSYGNEYKFDKSKKYLFAAFLRNRSIRYAESECDDLPPNVPITRHVTFPAETLQYYERVLRELRAARGNYNLMENAFMRMRQMCSGFASAKGEDGTKISIRFGKNPKLDAIVEAIQETPPNRKVIVFHDFTESGRLICERLRKEKITHRWLHGGGGGKAKRAVADFKAGRCKVLVSSTAGAYGGNWQIANYTFFYESPTSPLLRRQMSKRADRGGQTRTTFTVDFVVRDSVEEKIVKFLKEGKDLFDALVEGKNVL